MNTDGQQTPATTYVGGADSASRATVVVRPITEADYAAVAELTEAAYVRGGHVPPEDAYLPKLRDVATRAAEAEVLVAEIEVDGHPRVAGSVVLAPHGNRWAEVARPGEFEFRMLAVHPDLHRRGVARALLEAVIERARLTEGVHAVVLTTMPSMAGAFQLYDSYGFERVDSRMWKLSDVLPGLPAEQDKGPFLVLRLELERESVEGDA
jgi:ribosomal protein S18 acetylase RimI-like enzyme